MFGMDGEIEKIDGELIGEITTDLPELTGELMLDSAHYPVISGDVFLASSVYVNNVLYGTTESWNRQPLLIAEEGVVYVYSDHGSVLVDGSPVDVPAIKIGDGSTYLIDLPFVDADLSEDFQDHINNTTVHVTAEERILWNKRTYVHEQAQVSDVWTITHDLDKHPSVTVVDSAGTVVVGDVQYIDNSNIIITFNGAFSGTAYLN